jgi:hypothetical protein
VRARVCVEDERVVGRDNVVTAAQVPLQLVNNRYAGVTLRTGRLP